MVPFIPLAVKATVPVTISLLRFSYAALPPVASTYPSRIVSALGSGVSAARTNPAHSRPAVNKNEPLFNLLSSDSLSRRTLPRAPGRARPGTIRGLDLLQHRE